MLLGEGRLCPRAAWHALGTWRCLSWEGMRVGGSPMEGWKENGRGRWPSIEKKRPAARQAAPAAVVPSVSPAGTERGTETGPCAVAVTPRPPAPGDN